MVDASLRPRPVFGTFLQSDNSLNDGLTYYDYQRLVRSKKVVLLQEKRERAYEPGYKKVGMLSDAVGPVSRKVFQFKSKNPSQKIEVSDDYQLLQADPSEQPVSCNPENMPTSQAPWEGASKLRLSPINMTTNTASIKKASPENVNVEKSVKISHSMTERLPPVSNKLRVTKSATFRDHSLSYPSSRPIFEQKERPNTTSGIRNNRLHADKQGDGFQHKAAQTEHIQNTVPQQEYANIYKMSLTDGSTQLTDLEEGQREIDKLSRAYTWKTSSQRASDEIHIGWNVRMPYPAMHPPPASTVEQFPDPVSQRLTFRRYHSEPAEWQSYGTLWDFGQSRPGSVTKGPQGINYSHPVTQQIPGYFGHISGSCSLDNPSLNHKPILLLRTLKPRQTITSRWQNIPGYTGHVHKTSVAPALSDMPLPEPTTSARTHRHIPLEEEPSPFGRTSVFSKMVTTVSPYNPYNKVET